MKRNGSGLWPVVTTDGRSVVSNAGTVLLRELSRTKWFACRSGGGDERVAFAQVRRDPGQVLVDLAVTIANGGEAISNIAGFGDQQKAHGPVASTRTALRVPAGIDELALAALARARAAARERD